MASDENITMRIQYILYSISVFVYVYTLLQKWITERDIKPIQNVTSA